MADVVQLRGGKSKDVTQHKIEDQLNLPLDSSRFAGNLVCIFQSDIQPDTLPGLLASEGVRCVADMRRVPFFAGDSHRHEKLNRIFSTYEIPVFHLGVAISEAIDKNLPDSIKFDLLLGLVDTTERVDRTVNELLSIGSALIVVDEDPVVLASARLMINVLSRRYDFLELKVNPAWSEINRQIIQENELMA